MGRDYAGARQAEALRPDRLRLPALVVVIAGALVAAVVCGCCNGMLVTVFQIQPIVATLILMVAGRGVAQLITDGQIITFTDERLASIFPGGECNRTAFNAFRAEMFATLEKKMRASADRPLPRSLVLLLQQMIDARPGHLELLHD